MGFAAARLDRPVGRGGVGRPGRSAACRRAVNVQAVGRIGSGRRRAAVHV